MIHFITIYKLKKIRELLICFFVLQNVSFRIWIFLERPSVLRSYYNLLSGLTRHEISRMFLISVHSWGRDRNMKINDPAPSKQYTSLTFKHETGCLFFYCLILFLLSGFCKLRFYMITYIEFLMIASIIRLFFTILS